MKAMLIGALSLAVASPAAAQGNPMKECGARYQAAKTAKMLPAGQTWPQYLAACRTTLAPAAAKTVAVHAATTTTTTKTNAPAAARTPGQAAEASRQKQCGTMWKADKAAGKTGNQTWPQYWSACSKRLKG